MRAELKDFSGGITDFIFTADNTCSEYLDNFVLTKDKAPEERWGSRPMDPAHTRPVVSVLPPANIIEFQGVKVIIHGGQVLIWNGTAWTEVLGFNGGAAKCLTEGNVNSEISWFEWNKHLFMTDNQGSKTVKLYKDAGGVYRLVTGGLPEVASLPTVTPSVAGGKSYIYYYHYSFQYTVGDVTHIDYGPVIQHRILNAADMVTSHNTISTIPVLVNTTKTHYNTTSIKVRIYRSIDAGSEGYFVGEVTNGTTTFTDSVKDLDLVINELLYISAGVSDNSLPPVAKYLDLSNTCGWYANLVGFPYRVMQSQVSDPDSVPESYFLDFEEEITGIASYQSNPIVFTTNQIWRIEGVIELDGTGSQRKVMVTESLGTINHNSIVKTDTGLFFAGPDSFYWTDGYQVKKIPDNAKNIPTRYAQFSGNSSSIKGAYDRINNRVFWTAKTSTTEYQLIVYDVTFNALTTWSGQSNDFRPTGILCSKDRYIYRADASGYIFVHDPLLYSDPVINSLTLPSTWATHPVVYHFRHIAYDFGVSDVNKWVTRITVSGEGKTNLDVAVNSYDDSAVTPRQLVAFNHKSGLLWGDFRWEWENETDIWGLETRLNQTRHFSSGKLRCKRKQIEFTNAIITISESTPGAMGVVNSAAKTITISNPSTVYIPTNANGMDMIVNGVTYKIVSNTSSVFTLTDTSNLLVDGTYGWSIEAYPDGERFNLSSIIYTYDTLDDKGGYFQKDVTVNA